MKVYLGADHGGYEMKEVIKKWLLENHYEVEDCGAFSFDAEDDYPDFTFPAAEKVAQDSTGQVRGILSCRSSGGAVIAANKVKGIRAVSVFDVKSAKHAVEHNNANMIGISGDWSTEEQAKQIVAAYVTTSFPGETRHTRRIQKIADYEQGK
jgi:ribose 5-phosphate isomerase B